MFCSSCGGKLQEGAAFCQGCGAKAGEAPVAQPSTVAPTQTTVAREFRCNGCGSPLKIPTNSSAPVRCPSCKTECLIERAIKNTEIAAKENIESGVPLTASPAMLHRILVHCIAETPGMPIDVFDKVEVLREEHYCVPAYFFSCNGTETFTYDVANVREQTVTGETDDHYYEKTVQREEWDNGRSSTAAVRMIVIASGNREMTEQVESLYGNLESKKLVDIEELIYPADVNTVKSDVPQTMAYNEFAVPVVEYALKEKAVDSLSKQKTRDLQMGGANIQKDVVRIFLGMYYIVFKYGDQEYSIWVSGDGERFAYDSMPVDTAQKAAVDNTRAAMEREVSAVPVPKSGKYTAAFWINIAFWVIVGGATAPGGVLVGLIFIVIGSIIIKVLKGKMMQPYNDQCAAIRSKYQGQINSLEAGARNAVQQFKSKKQPLKGIYEQEVAGDASAF